MEWKNLSDKAKSVIEWIENPYTGRRETIKIEVGGWFNPISAVNIEITDMLFKEILLWVENDKELTYELEDNKLTFRLSDESQVRFRG